MQGSPDLGDNFVDCSNNIWQSFRYIGMNFFNLEVTLFNNAWQLVWVLKSIHVSYYVCGSDMILYSCFLLLYGYLKVFMHAD